MTDLDLDALEKKARAATEQSGNARWAVTDERDDGTAQVYSPSLGPLRKVVPVAETSHVCGEYIAAASPDVVLALVARAREAEGALEMAEAHLEGARKQNAAWKPVVERVDAAESRAQRAEERTAEYKREVEVQQRRRERSGDAP